MDKFGDSLKKNVIISVRGIQNDGKDEDVIELVTQGQYYKRNSKYYVTYKETELTGMEGTTTTLKIDGEKVTMMRFGGNNTQLIFEKGQKHLCGYETPYGAFTVGVYSNEVDVHVDDNGGELSANYQIEIDNLIAGTNDFYMSIRECH